MARDRRISIEDAQLRHGRKTKSVRIDGSKRHVLTCLDTCLDTCLVAAVGVTAANVAEAEATVAGQITADLDAQKRTLAELDIDRAYLLPVQQPGPRPRPRPAELLQGVPRFPVRNGPRFAKTAFTLDFDHFDHGLLTCPNHRTMAFTPGGKVQFPASPPPPAGPAHCGPSAPPAPGAAACSSTPTSTC